MKQHFLTRPHPQDQEFYTVTHQGDRGLQFFPAISWYILSLILTAFVAAGVIF